MTLSTEPWMIASGDDHFYGVDTPVVRAVDEMHDAALRAGASDIHIEPTAFGGRIRLRVGGILRETQRLPAELFVRVVSRLKVLAAMDIADKRQPQDGHYAIERGDRSIDARVASLPTTAGEKLVVRLLDVHSVIPTLPELGMRAPVLDLFRGVIGRSHGFIVLCGPTGSGKTTTAYAAISERNLVAQHICTVEDPVEVRLPGMTQVQVNARAGVTFASALRSFLRADPDVVLIGEMRDRETANAAVSSALSGRLVVTTLHAGDARQAVERLGELGVRREALAAGLSGVLAQRLIAGAGYRGRRAVFEFTRGTDAVPPR